MCDNPRGHHHSARRVSEPKQQPPRAALATYASHAAASISAHRMHASQRAPIYIFRMQQKSQPAASARHACRGRAGAGGRAGGGRAAHECIAPPCVCYMHHMQNAPPAAIGMHSCTEFLHQGLPWRFSAATAAIRQWTYALVCKSAVVLFTSSWCAAALHRFCSADIYV